LKNKRKTLKEETDRTKIDDEIAGIEASIETYRSNIKTETSKKIRNEEEENIISTKITSMDETVRRLE